MRTYVVISCLREVWVQRQETYACRVARVAPCYEETGL